MATARDWTRFLAVAAGYAAAFLVLRRATSFSLESPWFASAAMVCFLGLAFMARPLVPIRMPRGLRTLRGWEARLYRRLGVTVFGRLLRDTPLRWLNRDVYLGGRGRTTGELSRQLEAAEASHFWAAVLLAPYMVRLCFLGAWTALFWITVLQVLGNLYPVMHLRLTRHRLGRLAARPGPRR